VLSKKTHKAWTEYDQCSLHAFLDNAIPARTYRGSNDNQIFKQHAHHYKRDANAKIILMVL